MSGVVVEDLAADAGGLGLHPAAGNHAVAVPGHHDPAPGARRDDGGHRPRRDDQARRWGP